MDHLPKASPAFHHIEVPYIFDETCPYVYDNAGTGAWATFPERCGWSAREMAADNFDFTRRHRNTLEQAASMLQAWLYFGMIQLVTNLPVATEDYIRSDHRGHRIITTEKLPEHLERFRQGLRSVSEKGRPVAIARMDERLKWWELCFSACAGKNSPLPTEVVFSMMILLKTLIYAKLSVFPGSNEPAEAWYGTTQEMLHRRLQDAGCCQMDVYRLHQRLSSLTQYYMSSLNIQRETRSHDRCTETRCVALQIDGARHTSTGCTCALEVVGQPELKTAVKRGSIATMTFSKPSGLCMQDLNVQVGKPHGPYVAISHLWADGLGNPENNAMPRCQLALLQERVNALCNSDEAVKSSQEKKTSNVPFWIDTLCVPAKDCEEKILAIASMALIYKEAETVLVIDKKLECIESEATVLEISARIAMSPWWTRLWTLQEGAFAKDLRFQLRKGAVSRQSLLRRDRKSDIDGTHLWSISQAISEEALRVISDISRLTKSIDDDQGRYLLQSLNWRFATYPEDETICLSILLKSGAEVEKIQKTPPSIRLQEFIKWHRFFPSVLLFVGRDTTGSLEEEGYRWAPKALIGRYSDVTKFILKDPNDFHYRPRVADTAYADHQGFHVQYPGMTLDVDESIQTDPTNPQTLNILNQDDGGWYDVLLAVAPNSSISWASLSPSLRPALIVPRPLSMAADDRALKGILVAIYKEQDGELFCHRQCEVRVRIHSFNFSEEAASQFVTNRTRAQNRDITQKWCVG